MYLCKTLTHAALRIGRKLWRSTLDRHPLLKKVENAKKVDIQQPHH